ncbi:MAG: glucosaminidase domain-containing protein [Bacteroidota bacterium]|jgi:flagellum-specific peptidoglycan hydrolase FlgJ
MRSLFIYCLLLASFGIKAQRGNPLLDTVREYICEKGIKHPDIVMKQVILETGWLQSKYLMNRNNLFGFRVTKEYMRFKSWRHSVDYYKGWQDRKYKDPNEDYYKFLVRIHYAVKEYPNNLKKIKYTKTCNNSR